MIGILGQKLGMGRIFDEQGNSIPVTVISAGPCVVVQVKTREKDGYTAVQLGFGERKEKNVPKPLLGHFKKSNLKPTRWLREIRLKDTSNVKVGDKVTVDIFKPGEKVDVTGTTKGKGFQGVVKRHGFKGGPRTHGQSDKQRSPGAIGSQRPQRVKKGTKMAGKMGNKRKTIQNLEIVKVDKENNILLVKGSVPGPKKGLLVIRKAVKFS